MGTQAVSTYMGLRFLFTSVCEGFAFGIVSGMIGSVC